MKLTALAPGKVNLSLYVGAPREDGLHPLKSVVQSVSLADELTLEPIPGEHDEVVCQGVDGPNLAAAALKAFREATGWDGPAQRLTIRKRVPVAAGMGGGSGDAAAALRLAAHAAGGADPALLMRLAAGLGADVSSQVVPGRTLMTGAGEHVTPLRRPRAVRAADRALPARPLDPRGLPGVRPPRPVPARPRSSRRWTPRRRSTTTCSPRRSPSARRSPRRSRR